MKRVPGKRTERLLERLKEKYYHSKGAVLANDGIFEGAILSLRKALSITETPYVHLQLSDVYVKIGNIKNALSEIEKAITLRPDIADYHYRQGTILRKSGDIYAAERAFDRAFAIDRAYENIDSIQKGLRRIGLFTETPDVFHNGVASPGMNNELPDRVKKLGEIWQKDAAITRGMSCNLPCPAYCCYFSDDLVVHGVTIGPWKLHSIREYLGKNGLDPDAFIERMPLGKEKEVRALVPPDMVIRENGIPCVFFPRRGRQRLGKRLLGGLPRGVNYDHLVWLTGAARKCVFRGREGCMIHDTGGDEGIPACKEFFCFTGLVFFVARACDAIDSCIIEKKTMAVLNRIAIEALGILSLTVCSNKLLALKRRIGEMAGLFTGKESKEGRVPSNNLREEIQNLSAEYLSERREETRRAKTMIEALLSPYS